MWYDNPWFWPLVTRSSYDCTTSKDLNFALINVYNIEISSLMFVQVFPHSATPLLPSSPSKQNSTITDIKNKRLRKSPIDDSHFLTFLSRLTIIPRWCLRNTQRAPPTSTVPDTPYRYLSILLSYRQLHTVQYCHHAFKSRPRTYVQSCTSTYVLQAYD